MEHMRKAKPKKADREPELVDKGAIASALPAGRPAGGLGERPRLRFLWRALHLPMRSGLSD